MPRVSLVEKDQAHPVVKELYQKNEEQGWPVINLFKVVIYLVLQLAGVK